MATLNLGRIKPVFQGAYSGSTAYVVDDIVTFGDETFICIQASTGNATSNASYWTKLAAKGTGGTDVGTTLTTQGDILYRDGSGLQRLPKGTAGQVLKMNSSANAPEYGNLSSDYVRLGTATASSSTSIDFNGLFTSDYDVYRLFFHNVTNSSSGADMYVRFMQGGSAITSSTYNYHVNQEGYNDGGINSAGVTGAYPSGTDTKIRMNGDGITSTSNYHAVGFVEIYNPLEATSYKAIRGQVHHFTSSKVLLSNFFGRNQTTSALSGISILPQNGNFTTGKFHLYGMKNS